MQVRISAGGVSPLRLWVTEQQTDDVALQLRVGQTLHSEVTPYQRLDVVDTDRFGKMLLLDGMVQTTERDEWVYHEMISHVGLFTHPAPKRVAIVGGGDGGAVREALKHKSVEQVTLVEIDERVIEASRKYLPTISSGLDDERTEILVADGIQHIRESKGAYDVVMIDSTEPVGAAVGLFSRSFYEALYEAVSDDGLIVAQTESPFYNADLIRDTNAALRSVFPIVRLYLAFIPTYPSGMWSFTLASKKHDPLHVAAERIAHIETRYFTREVFHGSFALPRFVEDLIS